MKQEATVELFHYWNRLRDGRPAPKRTEVEPADIKTLLADTFILEKDGRGEPVFRLAGTRLCAIYGRELKGFSFGSLWRERDRRILARLLNGMFIDKSVVVVTFDGISSGGRTMPFELVVLPLEGGDQSARSIGLVTPCERAFWLGADRIVDANITSMRVFDPQHEPLFLKNRPEIEVPATEGPAPEALRDAVPGTTRRVQHLVVLEGGRED